MILAEDLVLDPEVPEGEDVVHILALGLDPEPDPDPEVRDPVGRVADLALVPAHYHPCLQREDLGVALIGDADQGPRLRQ